MTKRILWALIIAASLTCGIATTQAQSSVAGGGGSGLISDGSAGGVSPGDTLTGVILKDYGETLTTVAAAGATETLDLEAGNTFDITMDVACTFTFSNPPASGTTGSFTLLLRQDAPAGNAATFPASVDWAGGVAPTLTTTASALDILTFITVDGGTIWHGMLGSADSK